MPDFRVETAIPQSAELEGNGLFPSSENMI